MFLKLLGVLALTLILGVVGAVVVGGARWRAALEARDEALTAAPGNEYHRLDGEALPAPVHRYLSRAFPAGSPPIALARFAQAGTFQMGEGADGWRPFEATEVMSGSIPGFYWDAVIRMAPGLGVKVRDSYVRGSAEMVGRILGVIPVLDAADDPELRRGALARYLAEAAWIPSRLGMGPGLTWRAVDTNAAEATLVDGGTSVSLRFTFDGVGDLVEVAGSRPREVDGEYVVTPWIGRFRDHENVAGYRIPRYGEVAWVIDGEERAYWRGTIVEAAYVHQVPEPPVGR